MIHAFDFLESKDHQPAAVTVLFGEDSFLKRLVREQLVRALRDRGDRDAAPTVFDADVEWPDFLDALSTRSLFGGGQQRMVIVEDAGDFVSRHRAPLEDYVDKPRSSGLLVLVVGSWASNTRLYKAIDKSGLQIECNPPWIMSGKRKSLDQKRLSKWLVQIGKSRHQAILESAAATALLDIIGPDCGRLDQELAKLALYVDPGGKINAGMVHEIVGGWRAKTTWELIDAAAAGDTVEALRQLDRLLQAGEHPLALFGQISWSLRRYAAATRAVQRAERAGRPVSLSDALQQGGFRTWPREGFEAAQKQLRQLGRARCDRLYDWLLQTDLALKGSHSQPDRARLALETLFARLNCQLGPAKT